MSAVSSLRKKICLVTPVFNSLGLLKDTIHSILSQKRDGSFELTYFVMDGGSTDGTSAYLKSIEPDFAAAGIQFSWHSEKDNGMYDALAKGFKRAGLNFDIYSYINAGDYYAPYALSRVAKVLHSETKWITGLRVYYNAAGEIVGAKAPYRFNRLLIQQGFYGTLLDFIPQESTFWTNELHKNIDLNSFATFKYAGDFFLWHTFAQTADLQVASVWLSGFRQHDGQLSSSHAKQYDNEFQHIRSKPAPLNYLRAIYYWIMGYLPESVRWRMDNNCYVYR